MVKITECCGREECGGECGNEWRGMKECTCGEEGCNSPTSVTVDPAWEKAWDDKSPQRGS